MVNWENEQLLFQTIFRMMKFLLNIVLPIFRSYKIKSKLFKVKMINYISLTPTKIGK